MWPFYYWIFAILSLIVGLYFFGKRKFNRFKSENFPYNEDDMLPFIGSMGPVVMRKMAVGDLIKHLYNKYDGYSLIGMFDFTLPTVMVRDPEIIKLVTVKDFDHFADRVNVIPEEIEPLFGKNLPGLTGQRWKDMRSLLSPTFTTSKMKAMFRFVTECGDQLCNYLEEKCKGEKNGVLELEMKDLFTRYANDVIATSAFGIHCDSLREPENEFYVTGKDITNFGGIRLLIFTGYRICASLMKFLNINFMKKESRDFFTSLIADTVRTREKEGIIRPDMIHLLMEARKGNLNHDQDDEANDGSQEKSYHKKLSARVDLSDEDITAQALIFFLAGFDTASTNLCFLTNLLAVNPDIQKRLQEEIDSVLEEDGGKITYDGISRMKFLDMCLNESLRLWPPGVLTNRQCSKAYTFPATKNSPSFRLNEGESLWIPIYGIHRDPKYFDEPDRFDPDRFSDENKHNIQPFTFMPFGTGPRNCIGMRFALMEAKLAMVALLSRFDLVVTAKTQTTLKLAKKSFNMRIEGGFWLGFKLRIKNNA